MAIGIKGSKYETLWEELAKVDVASAAYQESGTAVEKDTALKNFLANNNDLKGKNQAELIQLQNELLQAVEEKRSTLTGEARNQFDAETGKVFRHLNKLMDKAAVAPKKDRSDPNTIDVARGIEATTEEWKQKMDALVDDKVTPPAPDAPTVTSPPVQPKQTFAQRFMSGVRGVLRNAVNTMENSRIAIRIREAVTGKQVIAKVGPASPEEQKEIEKKIVELAAETKAADEKVDALLSALAVAAKEERLENSVQQKASFPPMGQEDELSADQLNEMDEMIGDLEKAPVANESDKAESSEIDEIFDAINASGSQNAESGPQESSMTEEEFMAEANPPDPAFEQEFSADMEKAAKQEALAEAILEQKGDPNQSLDEAAKAVEKINEPDAPKMSEYEKALEQLNAALDMLDEPAKGATASEHNAAQGAKKMDAPTIPSGREGPSRG